MGRFSVFFNLCLCVFLIGCTPTIDSRGYNPETLDIAKIQVGVDTTQTIQEHFGSPSTISTFDTAHKEQSWYYISKQTSTTSFFNPDILKQQTIVITFDRQGVVKGVDKYQGEHLVVPVARKTETTGYETSVLRDVFGNFGRYNTKKTP